jgi:hypothetical protein
VRASIQTYTVTVPDEPSARSVAGRLAARGHRLVAVRPVGVDTIQPQFSGWWYALSALQDPPSDSPPAEPTAEIAAVAAIARLYGGSLANAWGSPPMALRVFPRDGLVHEISQEESEKIRAGLTDAFSAASEPVLPPGLRCGPTGSERELLRAVLAVVAATPGGAGLDPAGWDDPFAVIETLHDKAMHQGTVRPHTAAAVPLLAAFATAEGISDHYAADAMNLLLQMAVAGRAALFRPENADEAAARAAVERVVPALPAGRCELTDFVLGALAAAAGIAPPPGVDAIAAGYPARKPAVDLLHAPSSASALEALRAARPDLADARDDPRAPVESRSLALLARLTTWEVDNAREARP